MILFCASLLLTLIVLYLGSAFHNYIIFLQMMNYSIASSREDGSPNYVVLNGNFGSFGEKGIHLEDLTDGYLHIEGSKNIGENAWKRISAFKLDPGVYTLTGMKDQSNETVALQLYIEDDTGFQKYIYQYDDDVSFAVDRSVDATLHIRVYPAVEEVDVIARPAVYKDE